MLAKLLHSREHPVLKCLIPTQQTDILSTIRAFYTLSSFPLDPVMQQIELCKQPQESTIK